MSPTRLALSAAPVKRALLVLLAVGGFSVAVWMLVATLHARSPVYHGKTVKTWLLQLSATDPKARNEAEAAFQALGTNAVPELARLLRTDDARWRKLVWAQAARLPKRARWLVQARMDPPMRHVIRPAAAQALGKLGPGAAPAVPALVGMLREGNPYEQAVAGQSLGQIGAPALAALVDMVAREEGAAGGAASQALLRYYRWPRRGQPALEGPAGDPGASIRQEAIEKLGTSGRADEAVIRVLARAAWDPAPGVRLAALKALARADQNLHLALPQLVACSRDDSPVVREWSARALGKAGSPGRAALAALTRLAQDKEEAVRVTAQQALEAIQASGATNTPVPPK